MSHVTVRIARSLLAPASVVVEVDGLSAHDTEEALRVIANEVAEPLARAIGVASHAVLLPKLEHLKVPPPTGEREGWEVGTSLTDKGLVYVALMDDDEPPGTDRVAYIGDPDTASRAYAWLKRTGLPHTFSLNVRGSMYPPTDELDVFEALVRQYRDDVAFEDGLDDVSEYSVRDANVVITEGINNAGVS